MATRRKRTRKSSSAAKINKLKNQAHKLLNIEGTLESKLEKTRNKRKKIQDEFRALESTILK
jgi:hypothetical protein